MFDFLYEDIAGKIKRMAKWTFIVEAISSVIAGIAMAIEEDGGYILISIFGPIVAWVSSWVLYAFGQIVEDVHAIRNKEGTTEEVKVKREVEEKARREATEKAKREAEEKAIREREERARREATEKDKSGDEKKEETDEKIYEQHVCSNEQKLKEYIEIVLNEKSRPQELLDLYWQYKKFVYGFYPKSETKDALEKVIEICEENEFEGNSQLMITVSKTKISTL